MNIRYFAWVRERVGLEEEAIDVPAEVVTVADLIGHLKSLDDRHAFAFEDGDAIRVALDQMHVEADAEIGNAKEAAFFPPMTGG
ncbi:molybdopterin converting factor subunit 1 [Labrenzia sp. PHM005]|uniref:molybdopterin converting factor subunit 1 n=1 Tax=Labrenzia sp. PHM005 TaxID=2590016 RepID=UPI00114041FF|nr:molybdopterin converting factor subunit 1 [Labrenzia sp. PHM005]QDG76493.1 molybdopterin converting factor subunit 1 [Labrenzia sp. PHM005]